MTLVNRLSRLLGGHAAEQDAPHTPAPAGHGDMASAQQPKAIEIGAGYLVQIDGQKVAIAGTSQCLADTSRHDCIVIAPDTQVVEVLVGYPGQPRREAWTVKPVGEQRQLISGKGSPVIAAN